MKSTTRGTLAAVITGIAAAVGAATPAVAADTLPAPVPLEGAEQSLGVELPEARAEMPFPSAGVPDAPRYTEDGVMPDRVVPPLPLGSTLPGLRMRAPLPHLAGAGYDHLGAELPVTGLRALTPGLDAEAPLTPPHPDGFGLPATRQPQARLLAPAVEAVPAANLGVGPGL
ncbi:MAG TPA: hypothetical protein VFP69_11610 [Streptomyces sp.]|nr:hypothetical protein [Streptomyces sp.]